MPDMHAKRFIAGDWGTTNLRLFMCEYSSENGCSIVATASGLGVKEIDSQRLDGSFEQVLFDMIEDWQTVHGKIPVILSGMIGSSIGWREVPYLECPAKPQQIIEGGLTFEARGVEISILCGLRARNPIGLHDVMRGEELQLLGLLRLNHSQQLSGEAEHGDGLFALPGTHNKWVLVENGQIRTFVTALTGELFGLLKSHSVLISDRDADSFHSEAFLKGVQLIDRVGAASLMHALFSSRSEQLLGDLLAKEGLSYLSGLLIAADIIGARTLFGEKANRHKSVTLIGEAGLCERYAQALDYFKCKSEICDPSKIAIAGYQAVYEHLYC